MMRVNQRGWGSLFGCNRLFKDKMTTTQPFKKLIFSIIIKMSQTQSLPHSLTHNVTFRFIIHISVVVGRFFTKNLIRKSFLMVRGMKMASIGGVSMLSDFSLASVDVAILFENEVFLYFSRCFLCPSVRTRHLAFDR